MLSYKSRVSFEKRKSECANVLLKYPDKIPVIIEKDMLSPVTSIDKYKYLIPNNLTVSHLLCIIRTRIKLQPTEAIFIFVNKTIPLSTLLLSELYKSHKDSDGFLYITYSGENVFGSF